MRPGQSCSPAEFELNIHADMPYTLCASVYTNSLRFTRSNNCNPATERAYPLPDALPLAMCVNRNTAAILLAPPSGQCPPNSSTAVISQVAPVANADGPYVVLLGNDLVITTDDENDLLDNDEPGAPAGVISSFGIADASEVSVPGSTSLAGGTLEVNADGSFSLTAPSQTGEYAFLYRLENPAGHSDAPVEIIVQQAPQAVSDGPEDDSAPGDPYHTALDTTLDSSASPNAENLLANDELGFPEATLVSFGGGDLGGEADCASGRRDCVPERWRRADGQCRRQLRLHAADGDDRRLHLRLRARERGRREHGGGDHRGRLPTGNAG